MRPTKQLFRDLFRNQVGNNTLTPGTSESMQAVALKEGAEECCGVARGREAMN